MKTKIAIVGTGGVGGFLGGLLAAYYEKDEKVDVYFISRGEALKRIRENGLKVDAQTGNFVARPTMATDHAEEIGKVDYVIYCTKAYDVESGIRQIMPCIGPETVVLPFLNGVDSVEKIRKMLPENEVWYGCVYVVAYIVEPGHIVEHTNGYRYMFGSPDGSPAKINALAELFAAADIQARAMPDIVRRVWDKFAYISTVATVTTYTDKTYGEILSVPERKSLLKELQSEFQTVAKARGQELSPGVAEAVIAQMSRIPGDTTTSMQRDFRAGKNTELESLTGYIVREGKRLHVPTPTYNMMYSELKHREHIVHEK